MRGATHIGPVGLNVKEVASLPLDGDVDDLCVYDGSWYRHDGLDWVQISGAGLADPGGNGVVVRTALDTTVARTITGGTSIAVADGNGVSANPTITRAALTGDVTASADSNATTIAVDVVGNTKLANMPANTIKGNNTGGAADPADLTVAQTKTLLAITTSDVSGLAPIATSGSAADLSTGIIPDARMPNLTGHVTTVEGAVATTIQPAVVALSMLADLATNKLIGRATAGTGVPEAIDLTAAGRALIDDADAAAQRTTLGLAAIAASGSAADLSAGIVPDARMPDLTGDVTTAEGAVATTIAVDVVGNTKLANMPANTIKGNNTGGAADPADLTVAQTKTLLAIAAGDVSGLAPIATSGSASDLSAGTVPAARMPALTGDVTTVAGAVATTIGANKVLDTMLRDSAALSVIGRSANSTGDPADIAAASDGDVLRRSGTSLSFGAIPESSVTGLVSDLAAKVPTTRTVSTSSPLTGGGALSGDLTLDLDETVAIGNNARVAVNKNSGATVGTRRRINFIEGSNVTLTVTDDAVNEEVDISIAAAAGGGGMADPGGNGVVVRTALNTTINRTITGGTSITVADGSGVSANPTISRAALTGDVTAPADSNATTIAANAVTTAKITDANVTLAKMANIATDTLIGRDTGGSGVPEAIGLGRGLRMDGSGNLLTSGPWARMVIGEVSVTGAVSATRGALHYIAGTSTDYTITISGLSPAVGDVIAFYVQSYAQASKQYKLDAGGTVKIAGRTRYLVLLHSNVVMLTWDGTDWQPLVLCLDTPWVTLTTFLVSGTTLNATTTDPTLGGGTTYNNCYWRRCGGDINVRYEYRQTTAGTAGSGTYLYSIPIGTINTALVTVNTDAASSNAKATAGVGCGSLDAGGTQTLLDTSVYDTTQLRIATEFAGFFHSSASGQYSTGVLRFHFNAVLPMTDW